MSDRNIEIISHIFIGLFLLLICCVLNFYFYSLALEKDLIFFLRLIEYFVLKNSILHFSKCFVNWKYYPVLNKIVEFPNKVYPLYTKPYLKMIIGLIFFLCVFFGGIYFGLKFLPEKIGHDLSFETKAFLGITLSTILIRAFGDWLIKSLVRWYYKPDNVHEHLELTSQLVNEERIRYGIYIMFFISTVLVTFFTLEKIKVFNHEKMGLALISSFSAFIAFDRLFNSKNLIKFNPKKHRGLLVKVYEKDSKYNGQDNYLVNKIKSNVNLENPDDN
jgi:hypothetical protein